MQILNPKKLPDGKKRVVVLGNFDGVHKGHTKLISLATSVASKSGYDTCVYTFSQNSSSFKSASLLTTNDEKTEYIEKCGVNEIFFDDFDRVKDMSPEMFCKEILAGMLGCEIAVCGENFTFGKNRSGDAKKLLRIMKSLSLNAEICPMCFENAKPVSSSAIREKISEGDVLFAYKLLQRPYSFTSVIIHGKALARRLGYPTVNQLLPETKAKPKNGVYASICSFEGVDYPSVSNIGTKPTVTYNTKDAPVICESHIIGFDGDIYGKSVTVKLFERIRDEKKFDSLEELTRAVESDVTFTKKYFKEKGLL